MKFSRQKIYREHIAYFLGIFFLLTPSLSFAELLPGQCSTVGYTIATINGVLTNDKGASDNMIALKDKVGLNHNGQEIDYQYLLNPIHSGGLGDLANSVNQKIFQNQTVQDYDLVEMLNDASKKVKTQKLLLVAHSQGNFYANSLYDVAAGQAGGIPKQSIGVYSVATPASRVAGVPDLAEKQGGRHLTSSTDKVIAGFVGHTVGSILPANVSVELKPEDDWTGHGFWEVYLKYFGTEIVRDINWSLSRLSENKVQDGNAPCMSPPVLTIEHKIAGVLLAVSDPILNPTGVAIRWVFGKGISGAILAYNTAGVATKSVGDFVSAVTSGYSVAIKSLSNNTNNLAANNTASVILATQTQGVQPSPSVNAVINNQTTVALTPVTENQIPTKPPVSPTATLAAPIIETKLPIPTPNPVVALNQNFIGLGVAAPAPAPVTVNINAGTTSVILPATPEKLSTPILSVPQCATSIATDGCLLATTTVRFEWSAIAGADYYEINKNGTYSTTTATSIETTAPDFSDYTFEVAAVASDKQQSTTSTQTVSISTIPVAINEIAWMGTIASTNDEWFELKNNTAHIIDLSKWVLQSKDGAPYIILTGIIAPYEYRVFERRADTVTSVPAGQVYGTGAASWALSNAGEQLILSYASTTLDQTPSGAWVAGYNSTTTRRTMERVSSKVAGAVASNWVTNDALIKNGTDSFGNIIEGTPGAENSASVSHEADIIAPAVTILGSNPATVLVNTTYFDSGATAVDVVDGSIPVSMTSTVDTATSGTYTVTYTASDFSHNTATSTRTVNVVDVVDPLMIISSSDLNKNGIVDSTEAEVIVDSSMSLPHGEYNFNNLTITNNATLTLEGDPLSTDSFKGVKINAINITISSGSHISADGQGYSVGPGAGSGSIPASYGGAGGGNTATSTYGSAIKPLDLGSGASGYRGGGAIRIVVADTLLNDGSISANSGGPRSSGGSVYVNAHKFTGAGALNANGGNTSWPDMSAGGGGRVAVYYEQSSFLGTAKASGGILCFYGCNPAGDPGTVAFFDTINNDLYAGNPWRFQKNDEALNFNRIIISNGVSVMVDEGATVHANEIYVNSASSLSVSKGSSLIVGKIIVDSASVVFSGEEALKIDTLTLVGSAVVTVVPERILFLPVTNLIINSGSSLSVNAKGYKAGFGPGFNNALPLAGASYGGIGAGNTATSTYGSMREPADLGSGGDGYGGYGGGAMRVIVTGNLVNNGNISANATETSSGGSIYVTANNLSGTGEFRANGGTNSCLGVCVGAGGGGRIAIYYQTSSFSGVALAPWAGAAYYGYGGSGDGTVVMEQIVSTPVVQPEPTLPTATSTPTLSSAHSITSFDLSVASSTVTGVIDEVAHTISLVVPSGSDMLALVPVIVGSPLSVSVPDSGIAQDFTNPVLYTVTAEDGSTQLYTVTVTLAPDTAAPSITSYTLNGTSGDIVADFATTTPAVDIVMTASENVNWVSLMIEDQNIPTNYKTFFSGAGCVDDTSACAKSWDGTLSSGASVAPNGTYRIKAHIKDLAGNSFQDYLSPYLITVNRAI